MLLKVDRIDETTNTTLGRFSIDNKKRCYTLEDDYDPIKIQGETRIPAGKYIVTLRFDGGMFKEYSERFGETHPMLWIRDVPNYQHIYLHILNYHTETEGCIGLGKGFGIDDRGDFFLSKSEKAYLARYYMIKDALAYGQLVTIEIGDYIAIKPTKANIPDSKIRKVIKLKDRLATVSTLEKMWFDLDSKAVIMGSVNFVTARLTGYRWFKNKIKVENDQSLYGRLIELLNILISKLKGKAQ